jgi:uncharacterized damage-inducible protein DinB
LFEPADQSSNILRIFGCAVHDGVRDSEESRLTLKPSFNIMFTSLIASNITLLGQAREAVAALHREQYAQAPQGFHSSIGQHIRHILDHYQSLLHTQGDIVDYERRERNTPVESDPMAALAQITQVSNQLFQLPARRLHLQIEACHADAQNTTAQTSTERELMFVLSHTVHHFAIIGIYLRVLGISAPADFGVAPSTLRFKAQQASALPATQAS